MPFGFFWINWRGCLNAVLVQKAKNTDLLHCNQITFSHEFSGSLSQHLNESHHWRSSMEKAIKTQTGTRTLSHAHPHAETTLKGTLKWCLTSGKSTNSLLYKKIKNSQPEQFLWIISNARWALFKLSPSTLLNPVKTERRWQALSSLVGLVEIKAISTMDDPKLM